MKTVFVTQLEKKFISSLIDLLYAELGFSDVDIADMALKMHLSQSTCKGIMGSLVKKGLVDVDDNFKGIIYLSPYLYHYHPKWVNEASYLKDIEKIELVVQ